jgi:hypothetical protein
MHAAKLALHKERAEHGVVEQVEEGKDQLRKVGYHHVRNEPFWIGPREVIHKVCNGRKGPEPELPEVRNGCRYASVPQGDERKAQENPRYSDHGTAPRFRGNVSVGTFLDRKLELLGMQLLTEQSV